MKVTRKSPLMLLSFFNVPQEHVVKEELLGALYCEFINRVNEVGVDVNRAIAHPYTQSLVQYICGLGTRKGSQLLKVRPSPRISILAFDVRCFLNKIPVLV